MHWATTFIGIPWERNAQGPEAFDCWGFFRHVQHERFGVDVPDIGEVPNNLRAVMEILGGHPERENWARVDTPQEGDAVLMARSQHPAHIGIWIRANGTSGVLHCMQGAGVVYSAPAALRVAGWGGLTYYRHHPCTP